MANIGDKVQIEGVIVDRMPINENNVDVQIDVGGARYWVDERYAKKPAAKTPATKAKKPAEDKAVKPAEDKGGAPARSSHRRRTKLEVEVK